MKVKEIIVRKPKCTILTYNVKMQYCRFLGIYNRKLINYLIVYRSKEDRLIAIIKIMHQ